MQFTHRILAFDWLLSNRVWSGPVKSFAFKSSVRLGWRNFPLIAWYACVSSAEPSGIISCVLLISNHMMFNVKFGINKHLGIFQKPKVLSVFEKFTYFYFYLFIPNCTRNHVNTYKKPKWRYFVAGLQSTSTP